MENKFDRLERIENLLRAMLDRISQRRSVLITGGTGTLGTALTEAFISKGYDVSVVSRNPHRQSQFKQRFPDVELYLADICDYDVMLRACTGKDIVVHAAALKRVDIGESEITEFARVNINGTKTVADACSAAGVERALFISSDKAVSALNFYGVTKAAGERIWLDHHHANSNLAMRFSAVRYGNVMGSNGSVLRIWRERLAKQLPIIVRSPSTTRFFMRVQDAVQMIFDALLYMDGGEIFVPSTTPAFSLHDVALCVAPRSEWCIEPLGPREKQHELLVAPGEYHEVVSDKLCKIIPDVAGEFGIPDWACSRTARQLDGKTVIEMLETTYHA